MFCYGRREAATGGRGFILVVDQIPGGSIVHVYRREGEPGRPHDHTREVATFATGADATDGLDVTSSALGTEFPDGLLVMMNSSSKNFLLFPWRDLQRFLGSGGS